MEKINLLKHMRVFRIALDGCKIHNGLFFSFDELMKSRGHFKREMFRILNNFMTGNLNEL